jgi:hypothetical protein
MMNMINDLEEEDIFVIREEDLDMVQEICPEDVKGQEEDRNMFCLGKDKQNGRK